MDIYNRKSKRLGPVNLWLFSWGPKTWFLARLLNLWQFCLTHPKLKRKQNKTSGFKFKEEKEIGEGILKLKRKQNRKCDFKFKEVKEKM